MSIRDTITGSGAVAVIFDLTLNSADILLSMADILFTPVTIWAFTVAPNVDWVDTQLATNIAVVVASLYVIHLLTTRIEVFKNVRKND